MKSLSLRINLGITIVVAIAAIGLGFHDYDRAQTKRHAELSELGITVTNRLQANLDSPIWNISAATTVSMSLPRRCTTLPSSLPSSAKPTAAGSWPSWAVVRTAR